MREKEREAAAMINSLTLRSKQIYKHQRAMGQTSSSIVDCTNDFELVIRSSKELEFILEQHFGAPSGKQSGGLHEKISCARLSDGSPLPQSLANKMRFLATIRNKLVHDREFNSIPDNTRFRESFNEAIAELNALAPSRVARSCNAHAANSSTPNAHEAFTLWNVAQQTVNFVVASVDDIARDIARGALAR